MIKLLKSKLSFGVFDKVNSIYSNFSFILQYSIYINFSWSDTLNSEYNTSNDINLDYYSCLYNLGVIYCNLGRTINLKSPDTSDDKLKEGIKYFQHAAWLFDKLMLEVVSSLKDSELQPDLQSKGLNMVSIYRQ